MEQGAELSGLKILVVEDEPLLAMTLKDVLTGSGCTVVGPASTLKLGMRLIEKEAVDGAILDVNLRGEMVFPLADALAERSIPSSTSPVTAICCAPATMAAPFFKSRTPTSSCSRLSASGGRGWGRPRAPRNRAGGECGIAVRLSDKTPARAYHHRKEAEGEIDGNNAAYLSKLLRRLSPPATMSEAYSMHQQPARPWRNSSSMASRPAPISRRSTP